MTARIATGAVEAPHRIPSPVFGWIEARGRKRIVTIGQLFARSNLTRRELAHELFVRLPVGVAFLEELAFRGLLYTSLRRRFSSAQSITWSALAFAGWHFAVTYTSAAQTNLNDAARLPGFLRPFVQPIAVLGGMLTTGLAGAGFALLRERTGNLAGPIVAHWVVDGVMVAAIWSRRRK